MVIKNFIRNLIRLFEEKRSRKHILVFGLFIIHIIIPFCYITWLLIVFKNSPEFSIFKFEELGKLYYTRSVTCSFLFFTVPIFLLIFCYLVEVIYNKIKKYFQ